MGFRRANYRTNYMGMRRDCGGYSKGFPLKVLDNKMEFASREADMDVDAS